jgi:hypothetical protein
MTAARFDFYERVRIATRERTKAEINGKLAVVLGRAGTKEGHWNYAVLIYGVNQVWYCTEEELTATGEFDQAESFYNGDSIRVQRPGEVLE